MKEARAFQLPAALDELAYAKENHRRKDSTQSGAILDEAIVRVDCVRQSIAALEARSESDGEVKAAHEAATDVTPDPDFYTYTRHGAAGGSEPDLDHAACSASAAADAADADRHAADADAGTLKFC